MDPDAVVGCRASARTIDTLTASRLRQATQTQRKSCQLSERERRRQIKAMLSHRPACCFCVRVCVCVDLLSAERKQFLEDSGGEGGDALSALRRLGALALGAPARGARGGGRQVRVYERRSSGGDGPLATQSHSINCFRAKLRLSLWNLKKKKKNSKGRRAADPTRGAKAAADGRRGESTRQRDRKSVV